MRTLLIMFMSIAKISVAQVSPPLGPPVAGIAAIPLEKVKFSHIRNMVDVALTKLVENANKNTSSNASTSNINIKLSHNIISVLPFYIPTEYTDYPNSMTVQLRLQVEYTLSKISYFGFSFLPQKIYQEIVVTASCNDWHTNSGKSYFTYTAQKLVNNDSSIDHKKANFLKNNSGGANVNNNLHKALSDIFFVENTIISYINDKLPQVLSNGVDIGELPIKSHSCNCLNFHKGTEPNYAVGYIGFYFFPQRKIAVESLYSKPKIRLMSIKRLSTSGEWLGDVEEIKIEYMANYQSGHITTKPIAENELVNYKKEYSIEFEHPNQYQRLVVIANLTVLKDTYTKLQSGFLHFSKEQKYGEGLQKLIIMREENWDITKVDTNGNGAKVHKTLIPAYELTFMISYNKVNSEN